jgi:threonine/homoserine/homoserine lactone efflux protein
VPDLSTLLVFVGAALALIVIPGPAVLYILAQSVEHGRRAGVVSALGVAAGGLVHILAAAVGISALVVSSALAFSVVKYAGAAYLLFLGIRRLLDRDEEREPGVPRDPNAGRIFRRGVIVNILNPKTALFFLAFLPQFVDPDAAVPAVQILALGLWFDFAGTIVNAVVAVAAARAAMRLKGVAWLGRAARWAGASIMAALAVKLAFSESR